MRRVTNGTPPASDADQGERREGAQTVIHTCHLGFQAIQKIASIQFIRVISAAGGHSLTA